jgi:Mg2+ and Co2+ transporter CorA
LWHHTARLCANQVPDHATTARFRVRHQGALADSIRTSFNMLHHQLEDESRNRREENQRRLEVLAAAFLVPTVIVGFFGANTWLPGDNGHSAGSVAAFVIMIAALVILTIGAVSCLVMSRRRQRADEQRLAEERKQLRHAMGYGLSE